ncbi:MAG: ribosome small subunit-dependent GTPase A, partial [Burkholderiales bacterium]
MRFNQGRRDWWGGVRAQYADFTAAEPPLALPCGLHAHMLDNLFCTACPTAGQGAAVIRRHVMTATQTGLVIAAHGRHYAIETSDGCVLHCYPRGRNNSFACGDLVDVESSGDRQGTIRGCRPRTSLLYRSDRYRQKIIAANVTQAVMVVAGVPAFNEALLTRFLIACEQQGIKALIALNKIDLVEATAKVAVQLSLYGGLGYPVIALSAKVDISPLETAMRGHRNVVVGQSGMGKSTIVNALIPGARAATAGISSALDSGKHTTTSAHLYHADDTTDIIDSPGLQTFGLLHLSQPELANCFPEFRPFLGHCRFHDCRHIVEPGCAVIAATERKEIDMRRWRSYRQLMHELD